VQSAVPEQKVATGATGGGAVLKREEAAARTPVEGRVALDEAARAKPNLVADRAAPSEALNAPSQLPAAKPSAPAPAPSTQVAQENKIAAPLPAVAGMVAASKEKDAGLMTRAVASAPSRAQLSAFVPGRPVGWRYARPGVVLRTTDGGATWAEQAVPVSVRLLALSAVSPEVCWAAGASGAIVRTVDAATWQTVTPPVAADLVWIAALDERRATVRTADGIAYETSDGGASWHRQGEEVGSRR
jgi:hypothetical protein